MNFNDYKQNLTMGGVHTNGQRHSYEAQDIIEHTWYDDPASMIAWFYDYDHDDEKDKNTNLNALRWTHLSHIVVELYPHQVLAADYLIQFIFNIHTCVLSQHYVVVELTLKASSNSKGLYWAILLTQLEIYYELYLQTFLYNKE